MNVRLSNQSRRRRALALGTAGLLVFACNRSPTATESVAEASATVAQVAAAVTGQDAPLADEAKEGHFVGFDTHTYPGDEKMRAWKNAPNAPYSWVGFYLPSAPCHKGTSWSGKRQALQDMGWGVAVVYVGQQTWNRAIRQRTPAQVVAGKVNKDNLPDLVVGNKRGTFVLIHKAEKVSKGDYEKAQPKLVK